ncbi:MAG: STAS domain-containing protein [bacterium]|nr:STAS domain-containing protein [bacterium]
MSILLDIIKISQVQAEAIDYNALIFKVYLEKRVSMDNSKHWWIFFKTLADGGVQKLLIDMKDVEYIDSSGIGTLINVAKLMRAKDGDIVISNVSTDIKSVFKTINLESFIKIFNLEGEAMNYFRYD